MKTVQVRIQVGMHVQEFAIPVDNLHGIGVRTCADADRELDALSRENRKLRDALQAIEAASQAAQMP